MDQNISNIAMTFVTKIETKTNCVYCYLQTINYILVTKSYNKQTQIGVWFHVGGLGVKQQSNNVLWHNKKKLPTDTVNACIFFKRLLP